jgi:hydrogenase maturation protein HypF
MLYKKIPLPFKIKKSVLALGSQAKNTVCFASGKTAYVSRVRPDLSNPKELQAFEKDARYFLKKKPKIIAYDLHPEYQSTKFALNLPLAIYYLKPIQHHHAHIASCMTENGLKNQPVIGVAFDGTGLGADNHIWGAEFLICDYRKYKRAAHLKELPLLGGERAILEPWRLAAFWLDGKIPGINNKKWLILKEMLRQEINSPWASSMGRLFDASASLILGKKEAGFEAELAIELEKLALSYKLQVKSYKFRTLKDNNGYIIDPGPVLQGIVQDLKSKKSRNEIACRFHLTVAEMIRRTCVILRKNSLVNRVVLSGGVFQNSLLLRLSLGLLYMEGFSVFLHKELSPNDSGISLGQAVIAGI